MKTAIYGEDANWGRILAAIGNSGATFDMEKTRALPGEPGRRRGAAVRQRRAAAVSTWRGQGLPCAKRRGHPASNLGLGTASATAWGSDLTEEFVRLNSEYTT